MPQPKPFLCFSLRTDVPADAKALARRLTALSDPVFAATAGKTMPIARATAEMILTELVRFEIAASDLARAHAPYRPLEVAEAEARREAALQATLRHAIFLRDREVARAPLQEVARRLGVALDEADPDWQGLAMEATRVLLDVSEERLRRDRGVFPEPAPAFRTALRRIDGAAPHSENPPAGAAPRSIDPAVTAAMWFRPEHPIPASADLEKPADETHFAAAAADAHGTDHVGTTGAVQQIPEVAPQEARAEVPFSPRTTKTGPKPKGLMPAHPWADLPDLRNRSGGPLWRGGWHHRGPSPRTGLDAARTPAVRSGNGPRASLSELPPRRSHRPPVAVHAGGTDGHDGDPS